MDKFNKFSVFKKNKFTNLGKLNIKMNKININKYLDIINELKSSLQLMLY